MYLRVLFLGDQTLCQLEFHVFCMELHFHRPCPTYAGQVWDVHHTFLEDHTTGDFLSSPMDVPFWFIKHKIYQSYLLKLTVDPFNS